MSDLKQDVELRATATWQGSLKLVNYSRARLLGGWYVAEVRLRSMFKWITAIIAFGIGNPVLFLVSVGLGIGALVDKAAGPNAVDGVSYLVFLAPALLATAAIQAAMDETSFPTLEGFVWEKSFFGMNATLLTARNIVDGVIIASFVRCVLTAVLYLGVLFAFGATTLAAAPGLILSSIFAGMSFAAVMLAAASYVKEDDGFFAIVGRFVIAPMFMFSGTFYPIDSVPIYFQWFGWISPLWHATELGRNLSYGHSIDTWMLFVHYAYLALMLVVGMLIAYRQFARRLAK